MKLLDLISNSPIVVLTEEQLDEINRRGLLKGLMATAGIATIPAPVSALVKNLPMADGELLSVMITKAIEMPHHVSADPSQLLRALANISQIKQPEEYSLFTGLVTANDRLLLKNSLKKEFSLKNPSWSKAELDSAAYKWMNRLGNINLSDFMVKFKEITGQDIEVKQILNIAKEAGHSDPLKWLNSQSSFLKKEVENRIPEITKDYWSRKKSEVEKYNSQMKQQAERKAQKKTRDAEWKAKQQNKEQPWNMSGTATGKFVEPRNISADNVNFNAKGKEQ